MHRVTLKPSQCIKLALYFSSCPFIQLFSCQFGSIHSSLFTGFGRWCKFVFRQQHKALSSLSSDLSLTVAFLDWIWVFSFSFWDKKLSQNKTPMIKQTFFLLHRNMVNCRSALFDFPFGCPLLTNSSTSFLFVIFPMSSMGISIKFPAPILLPSPLLSFMLLSVLFYSAAGDPVGASISSQQSQSSSSCTAS